MKYTITIIPSSTRYITKEINSSIIIKSQSRVNHGGQSPVKGIGKEVSDRFDEAPFVSIILSSVTSDLCHVTTSFYWTIVFWVLGEVDIFFRTLGTLRNIQFVKYFLAVLILGDKLSGHSARSGDCMGQGLKGTEESIIYNKERFS